MLELQVLVNGIMQGAIFALMAVGLTLIFGILRVVNFAHGVLLMVGAYGTWALHEEVHIPYIPAIVLAMVGVGTLGILLELTVLRRFRGMLVEGCVAAIALTIIIQNVVIQIAPTAPQVVNSPFSGAVTVHGVTASDQELFILGLAILIIGGLALFVKRSRFGRSMRALQQHLYAARLQGIDPEIVAPVVFGIGAALAGLAGGLIAPLQEVVPGIGDAPLLSSFVVVVLGGMGSVTGTLLAAGIIGVVQSAATTYWSAPASVAVSFAFVIAVLVVRPRGLLGYE